MNTALTLSAPSVGLQEWEVMRQQAAMLVTTGFLPSAIKTPEQAVAIILQGRELGIPTMAALNTINVISGKPTVSPQLMLALIYRSHEADLIDVEEETDTHCVVVMKRRGQPEHREEFTIADANKMTTTEWEGGQKKTIKLSDKYNWRSMPKTMLKWRAIAACARVVFPDVVLGLYTPEEMGADVEVADDGDMRIIPSTPVVNPIGRVITKVNHETGEILDADVLYRELGEHDSEPPAPEPQILDGIRERLADQPGLAGMAASPELLKPASAGLKAQFERHMRQAEALEIDTGEFDTILSEVTQGELIKLDTRLAQYITAKQHG
jgi:hypothetical protein